MIDLIIKLLESLRSFPERKAERRKRVFVEVTEPAWHSFNKVHADYKASLNQYRELVLDENQTVLGLIERTIRDSILTMDLRSDLFSITNLVSSNKKNKLRDLSDFKGAISRYFWIFDDPIDVTPSPCYNTRRISLTLYLCCNGEGVDRVKVANLIDKSIEDLQNSYNHVSEEFFKLKALLIE
jgi:hypothetical protein